MLTTTKQRLSEIEAQVRELREERAAKVKERDEAQRLLRQPGAPPLLH